MRSIAAVSFFVIVSATGLLQSGGNAQSIRVPDFRQQPRVAPDPGPCDACGVIRSISEINRRRDTAQPVTTFSDSTAGTRVVGAVIVVPFGGSSAATTPFVGGVGTPEMQQRFGEISYQVVVRMDDGDTRVLERRDGGRYSIGDRVRLVEGQLELLFQP
jgi:outer membrane lipoprotein SlyB